MFEIIDIIIAETLNVTVNEYIDKIEKTTEKRAEVIIGACFTENTEKIEKARRCFNLIK